MDNQKATLELGTKPVGQLLMRYAVPAIIAMTASSLYNMVDSIFIGQGVYLGFTTQRHKLLSICRKIKSQDDFVVGKGDEFICL